MAYTKIIFQNSPSTATPINAQNLNHMDDQIALNDQRLTDLEGAHVSSFNGRTGAVTPADGDYDIGQIAPLSGAQVGQVPVVVNVGTEEDPELEFQMGAGGGGGHVIQDASGTDMPQESAMQFPDSFVSDDDVNGRTVVENIKEVLPADYDSTTDEGIIVCDDGNDVPIGASSEDKVEVDVTTSMTYADALNELFSHTDFTQISGKSYINFLGIDFYLTYDGGTYEFTSLNGDSTKVEQFVIAYSNGSGSFYAYNLYTHTRTDRSSNNIWANGKITLYYGTSSTVINLKTSADYCMMKTGVEMSVDSALGRMRFYATGISNGGSITLNFDATDRFVIYLTHSSTAGRTYVGIGCGGTNPHLDDIFPNANITKATGSKTITLTNNTGGTLSGWVEIQQTGAFSIT